MVNIIVQGKGRTPAPDHFQGAVAAGTGPRIVARLIDTFLPIFLYIIFFAMTASAISNASSYEAYQSAQNIMTFGMVCFAGLIIAIMVMVVTRGQTIGMAIVGLRWVSFTDGKVKGGNAFGKLMLEGLLGGLWITQIMWLVTQDPLGRHWFSRTTDIMTINIKAGRDTHISPLRRAATPLVSDAPQPPAPGGQPWQAQGQQQRPPVMPQTHGGIPSVPATPPAGHQPPPPAGAPVPPQGFGGTAAPTLPADAPVNGSQPPAASWVEVPPGQLPTSTPAAPPTTTASPMVAPPVQSSPFAPPSTQAPPAPASGFVTPPPTPGPMPTPPSVAPASANTPPVPPAVASATPATSAGHMGDVDELERTVARRPAHSVQLTFDDGTHHFLVGSALVGRSPEPRDTHPNAQLVTLSDPGRSISKLHIALSVQSGAVLVEDMHSLNGTTIITPEGTTIAVLPGAPMVAPVGATVYFGDRTVKIGG